jgi:hypothetical protein
MNVDGEIFRAVVTTPLMVRNPDYGYGRNLPYLIPSGKTQTNVYGPYTKKGVATAAINQRMKDGYGNPVEGVYGHVEKAHVAWEVVE